jgi:hypothetical protein
MFAVWVCESTFCPRNVSDWRVETEADSIVGAAVLAVEAQFILCVSADARRAREEGKGRENGRGTAKEEWWPWRANLRVCHRPSLFAALIVKTENPRFRRAKTARRGCVVPGNENAKTKLKGRETARAVRDLERLWLPG